MFTYLGPPSQRRLRDTHRNNTHRKKITNGNKNKRMMIFQTDDSPQEQSSRGIADKFSHRFAKQDFSHTLQEEIFPPPKSSKPADWQ